MDQTSLTTKKKARLRGELYRMEHADLDLRGVTGLVLACVEQACIAAREVGDGDTVSLL